MLVTSIALDDEAYEVLRRLAREGNRSQSSVIRLLLRRAWAEETAREALVGSQERERNENAKA